MPRQTTLIPKTAIARLFKRNGAPRVSDKAMENVVAFLTKRSEEIAERAIKIATHRNSRTVIEGDVELAMLGR